MSLVFPSPLLRMMKMQAPRWYLGQDSEHRAWMLPEGVSRTINVARAMRIKHKGNRLMVLRRAVELAKHGVEMIGRYQK